MKFGNILLVTVFWGLWSSSGVAQSKIVTESNFHMLRVASQQGVENEQAFIQRIEQRYLDGHSSIHRFQGDHEIQKGQTIEGDIFLVKGILTIAGKINGKAVVVNGDIYLKGSARVSEDVVSVNGQIRRQKGAKIGGEMIEATLRQSERKNKKVRRTEEEMIGPEHGYREWRRSPHKRWKRKEISYSRYQWQGEEDTFLWRYNRVDGLFLGLNFPPAYRYRNGLLNFDLNGFLGYGLASKTWRYRASAELWLFRKNRILVGGTFYDLTDTQDNWLIPTGENSLAASLIHEDFQDFFRRDGFGVYIANHLSNRFRVQFGYFDERYGSLSKKTDWALFGGGKKFRDNPSIFPGTSRAYKASLILDTRNRIQSPTVGWLIQANAEFSRPVLGSDFDYDRVVLDVRRYIPLAYGENLDLRFRLGSSRGKLPGQYGYYLGGLSTLRALSYKELAGNRMVLVNAEYRLLSWSQRLRRSEFLNWLNLILFVDSGYSWFASDTQTFTAGFETLKFNRLRTDIGFAISDDDGRVRLNFARQVGAGQRNIVVTFRLNRPF